MPLRTLLLVMLVACSSLVAGCLQQQDDGDDGDDGTPTFSGSTDRFGIRINDVQLHGEISPAQAKTWRFEAENRGSPGQNPVEYNEACEGPFRVTLTGPGGNEVQWREPTANCQAYSAATLDGGETLDYDWTWDARVWTDGAGYRDAPEGRYTLVVAFNGFHDGNPEHKTEATGTTGFRVR